MLALALTLIGATLRMAIQAGAGRTVPPPRPKGPCDIYAAAGDPCVAAHSTTRALHASYNGPLYQVVRQSDGKTLDIGVVQPVASPFPDTGGYADAAAQDAFCANTYCWITSIYDQSPKHNDLIQAPRDGFSGPAMGGFNNLPVADMAPITIMGHKAYGVFIAPGMGLRQNDAKGTAVDDRRRQRRLWPRRTWRRRHNHRGRAAQVCARGRCAGFRHRHHLAAALTKAHAAERRSPAAFPPRAHPTNYYRKGLSAKK